MALKSTTRSILLRSILLLCALAIFVRPFFACHLILTTS